MKVMILSLVLLMSATSALAERDPGQRGGGDKAEHRARMQQELGLTQDQVEQMREIRKQGGSREEMQAVLTDEQRAKARELRKSRQGDHAQRMQRMQEHLGLSDEQVQEMQRIREQGGSREEMQAVLTDEQRTQMAQARAAHKGKNRPAD
jgi:Spy/CpxP family protein refolding chaperone